MRYTVGRLNGEWVVNGGDCGPMACGWGAPGKKEAQDLARQLNEEERTACHLDEDDVFHPGF